VLRLFVRGKKSPLACVLGVTLTSIWTGGSDEESTREAEEFLTSAAFRTQVLETLPDDFQPKRFWLSHFHELRPAEQRAFMESARNKIAAFLAHFSMSKIFGQRISTINFERFINEGKALVVNLSRRHLKDDRRPFGALILSKLAIDIVRRASLPPDQRREWVLLCDEAPEYFWPDLAVTLAASARKWGLSYRLYGQTPLQYGPAADILFGCVGTIQAFCCDRKGGEILAKQLFSFGSSQASISEELEQMITLLTTQRQRECVIRLKNRRDNGNPWLATVPKLTYLRPDPDKEEAFRQASAAVYYKPLAEIEVETRERLARFQPQATNFRNRS